MADQATLVGCTLSHYRLERLLGAGGMGAVYLARDLALARPAAIKVVGDRLDPLMSHRLCREAEACARLQHPAIATFYESGDANGVTFIAMEYVRGVTLRARLGGGALPFGEALSIGALLLEALNHAHAAGILHRDLKPENIMLTPAGAPKLLDFGLVKAASASDDGAGATLTNLSAGRLMGTVGYISPEQLQGGDVDARADVFAAGAVLYEMISGQTAFPGASATERLASILTRDPATIAGRGVPPGVNDVLRRALARDRDLRYRSASALLKDLRGLQPGAPHAPTVQSLAVLDLHNLSGRAEDDWMGSGVAESLTSDLARVDGLAVVSRARVLRAARGSAGETPGDALEVGSLLGCRWVLSGGFQHVGSALRFTTQLAEVATGQVVAAEKLDGAIDAIFDMQDRLSRVVVASLNLRLPASHGPAVGERHVQAFEYYSRGRRLFLRLEKGGFDQARELYEKAIEIEPGHALALAGLAGLHAMRYTFTTDARELDMAAELATRSIAVDAHLAEPLVWLGYTLLRRGRYEEAYDTERRAEALDPGNSYPPYFSACARLFDHRPAEAMPCFQKAVVREPPLGFAWLGLAAAHLSLGRPDEALWCLGEAIALESAPGASGTVGARAHRGECLRLEGRLEEARTECLAGLETVEQSDHMFRDSFRCAALCSLARTAMDQGDWAAARAALEQVIAHLRGRPRTLGGGFFLTQALAGLARANADAARLDESLTFYRTRPRLNFDHVWFDGEETTLVQLAHAAAALGRDEAHGLLEEARALGSYEAARLLERVARR